MEEAPQPGHTAPPPAVEQSVPETAACAQTAAHLHNINTYMFQELFSLCNPELVRLCVSFLTCRHVKGDHCCPGLPDDLQAVLALIQTGHIFYQHGQQVSGHVTLNVTQDYGVLENSVRL